MKNTILYVMDPLCGWCYGFSHVMQQLQDTYKDTVDFKVIPGGMVMGTRVQPVSAMSGYVLQAYTRVEEYSGAKFGEPYLDMLREGSEISNSEPPCRAIVTFHTFSPADTLNFAHKLQLKQFVDGKSFNDEHTYRELATEFGIDADAFITKMESEEMRYATTQEFQWVQAAGINGFPCTVVQKGEQYFLAAQGFQRYDDVKATIDKILTN
jgi:putative protein-disulfide isomerase